MAAFIRKHELSGYAGKLLRYTVLETSLYTLYYLGFCVPCALHFIPLAHLLHTSLTYYQIHGTRFLA